MISINSFLACLFLLLLFFVVYPLLPSASAQKRTPEKIPMAHRAAQAGRYSEMRGLAIPASPLPVNISSTVIENKQPLRIQVSQTPCRFEMYDSVGNVIISDSIKDKMVMLDTRKLEKGIYNLSVSIDTKTYTYTVFIKD